MYMLSPTRSRPAGLLKSESTICASGMLTPFEKVPLTVPERSMLKSCRVPEV